MNPAISLRPYSISRIKIGESGYPACLSSIPSPPSTLSIVGRLPPGPRVALVGSRKADEYGLQLAHKLGTSLAEAGICVVSGGASGIDTAALRGCLEAGGMPVAVLGTGVDVVYPASNRFLFEQLAERGALVSEFELGTPGLPGNFVRRNRIISGLSLGVVIVQAAAKSGSLITAKDAMRQGRVLMAVPGLAGHRLSAGVHQLIKKGAVLVEDAVGILAALSIQQPKQKEFDLATRKVELNPEEYVIWDALGSDCFPVDVLSTRCGLQAGRAASLLLNMELRGLVARKPGMIYCRIDSEDRCCLIERE